MEGFKELHVALESEVADVCFRKRKKIDADATLTVKKKKIRNSSGHQLRSGCGNKILYF